MIYIDNREPARVIKEAKKRTEVKVVLLEVGDFQNKKETIFIERKTPADIWTRVYNRTWHDQLQRLQHYALDEGVLPWLLVEGDFDQYHRRTKGKMPIEQCKQAVASASIRYGLSVWRTYDVGETVETAIMLCKHADKGKLCNPKKIPFAKEVGDSRVGILMNLFRISRRQSISLLESQGSVIGVLRTLKSNPEALQYVDYVGPGTVKKMKRLMYSEFV